MQLKVFNQTNVRKAPGGLNIPARFILTPRGAIYLSMKGSELMELKAGDKISFAQDEADPLNWFAFKDASGFELRSRAHRNFRLLYFNRKDLMVKLLRPFKLDIDQRNAFLIAGMPTIKNGVKYWGLIAPPKI